MRLLHRAQGACRRHDLAGRAPVLVVVLLVVATALLLGRDPPVGAAENGDFYRVMRPAGIVAPLPYEAVAHAFVVRDYLVTDARFDAGLSSAAVLAWVAKLLGSASASGTTMDLRWMGGVYLALAAAALFVALRERRHRLLCMLVAWAALDVSYMLYWNSFFADPAALVGLLWIVLACLQDDRVPPPRPVARAGFFALGAALVGLSKNLYMATPAVLAVTLLVARRGTWATHLRARGASIAAAAVVGAVAVFHFTAGTGYRFPEINRHHAVFVGVAGVAADPAAALDELGVDPRYRGLRGRSYFDLDPADRAASNAAVAHVSMARILGVYLRHPSMIVRTGRYLREPLARRTTSDPNFGMSAGPPAYAKRWWQFAALRGWLVEHAAWSIGLVVVLAIGWIGRAAVGGRCGPEHVAATFLILDGATLLVGAVLGDGLFSLPRHLIGVRMCLDLLLALLAFVAGRSALARARMRRRLRRVSAGPTAPTG